MLFFRVDQNDKIATGHMMRCLSIADGAKKLGVDSVFVMADENGVESVTKRGYRSIVLHTRWDAMEEELPLLSEIIEKEQIQTLLVDSYSVTENYLRALRDKVHLAYIDDVNAFYYPVDTLICYAPYYKKFGYESRYENTKLLLGTSYMPLREEYAGCPEKIISEKAGNLLLLSGGADEYHVLAGLLEHTDLNAYERVTAVCGMYCQDYDMLVEKYGSDPRVRILRNVSNLKDYMMEADLAVSAGGTTLFELCSVGTPVVTYILADNQKDNAFAFAQDGIALYAGDVRDGHLFEDVNDCLERLRQDEALRKAYSVRMQQYVDGLGAVRIAKELLA